MKQILYLLLLLTIITASSCSSVRTRSKAVKNTSESTRESSISPGEYETADYSEDRFSDTTVIIVQPSPVTAHNSLVSRFEKSAEDFDNERYEESCGKFRLYAETFAKEDSLRYESLFYHCECLILENKINEAQAILEDIFDSSAPDAVKEKVIVRLGQIHCVNGDKKEAQTLFDLLRNRFPSSIYIPVANCDVVN